MMHIKIHPLYRTVTVIRRNSINSLSMVWVFIILYSNIRSIIQIIGTSEITDKREDLGVIVLVNKSLIWSLVIYRVLLH